MSKVSVIVPYLKGPSYLEECIQSVENQNLSDFEILLVDDKDGHDVPESVLAMKNVRHIVMEEELDADDFFEKKDRFFGRDRTDDSDSEERSPDLPYGGELEIQLHPFGVAASRNVGVRHATGEYLYFLDADDYLREDALAKLVALADGKKAKVVTGNRYSSWFRPISFSFEKAKADTEIEGVVPLRGEVLEDVLTPRFTVQHLLIRRDYYEELGLSFDEYNTFYSDVPVVTALFAGASEEELWADGGSIYVWRHRNDPIHLPALSQKKRKKRSREFIESYEVSRDILEDAGCPQKDNILYALNRWLCLFAIGKFPEQIRKKRCARYTANLRRITKPELKRIKKNPSFFQRRELEFLVRGKYRMARFAKKAAYLLKKKRGVFGKPIQYWKFLNHHLFQKLPIREDWVFVESFFGKSYSDSPKYLYEYLYDTYGDKYRYIWCLNERAKEMKGHPSICRRHSLRYVYYTSRAKYFICNTRQPAWFKKRKGVVFLETWHGTPLKKLAFDLDDIHAASQDHKKLFYRQSKVWDYLISANRFSTDVFERAFCYPREQIIEVGYPRNDILYSDRADEIAREVREEFGIPEGKRVILYAPTWRDNQFYEKAKYKFTLAMDLERMRREFGGDSVLLLRTHYYIADRLDLTGLEDFVYNGSTYNDVSRIYLASDICITDYSSVFFDYANLRRPMLFFAYDYEDYRGEIRGMYFDMERELPGPILKTNDELVDALHHIDQVAEKYSERYEQFYERFCRIDDGGASRRAIDIVFEGKPFPGAERS